MNIKNRISVTFDIFHTDGILAGERSAQFTANCIEGDFSNSYFAGESVFNEDFSHKTLISSKRVEAVFVERTEKKVLVSDYSTRELYARRRERGADYRTGRKLWSKA